MSLQEMPNEVMEKLVDDADYATIQSIRKVSRELRSFIDGKTWQFPMYELSLDAYDDFIKLQWYHLHGRYQPFFFNGILEDYSMYYAQEKLRVVVDGGRSVEKMLKSVKVHTVGFNDLEILLNSSLLKLKNLRTSFYTVEKKECRLDYLLFKEKLKNLFATRKQKVEAENLCFKVTDQSEILLILPHVDPSSVEDIFIEDSREIRNTVLDIGEVVQTAQWKNARTLTLQNCILSAPLKHFTHFDEAYINVGSISMGDVIDMKNGICQRNNFEKFKRIHLYYVYVSDEEELIRLLGEQTSDWSYTQVWLYETVDPRTALRLEKFENRITFQTRYVCPNMTLIPLE
ncbi:hypothetical protein CRE_09912 [Caenorhabditis remanei]|uniref:F-box domain-containing protein n=1 Tax=Caenorhabditis remanei TaxID=31234 RepID=E3NQ46_CAERE|nr:hypothetical protein CRE_09912 [Caenorhabditis remanei]